MTQNLFAIYGLADFAPYYAPRRFSWNKERNLDREENFCGHEDVSDLGAKNREIHISGLVRKREIDAYNDLLDSEEPVDLVSPAWSGEIRVQDGEIEGPTSVDPATGRPLFTYSLNVVSTGKDEL